MVKLLVAALFAALLWARPADASLVCTFSPDVQSVEVGGSAWITGTLFNDDTRWVYLTTGSGGGDPDGILTVDPLSTLGNPPNYLPLSLAPGEKWSDAQLFLASLDRSAQVGVRYSGYYDVWGKWEGDPDDAFIYPLIATDAEPAGATFTVQAVPAGASVPEPATIALFGCGLALIAVGRWRTGERRA